MITEVGTAFWYGFAFADLVVYIPLLAFGLLGDWFRKPFARAILGAALGITVYWPIVSLSTVATAREAEGWHLSGEASYWIVLPIIALWGAFGLWQLARRVPSKIA